MRRLDPVDVVAAKCYPAGGLIAAGLWIAMTVLTPAKADAPTVYASLPTSAVLPINPLVRPIHVDPTPRPTPKPTPRPTRTPAGGIGTAVGAVKGTATWYATGVGTGYAAAAHALREFLGAGWRGTSIRVCGPVACRRLVLDDYEASLIDGRLIDLSPGDFLGICGPLSRGVCHVAASRG